MNLLHQDDPTIMAWNLINEPRCNCAPSVVGANGYATADDPGSDCADINTCFTNIQVRLQLQIWLPHTLSGGLV